MKRLIGFWGNFEEDVEPNETDLCNSLKTQTRQREEPDQRVIALSTATATQTAQREELDQGAENTLYRALPYPINNTLGLGTQTVTEQREESDQDMAHSRYSVIPSVGSRK